MPPYSKAYMAKRGMKNYMTSVRFRKRQPARSGSAFKNAVRRVIKDVAEKQALIETWGNVVIDTTGTTFNVNDVAQGDAINQRQGLKTYSISIQHRFRLTTATGTGTNAVRLIWFIDTQQDAAAVPAPSLVLENSSPFAPLSTAFPGRWYVMKDKLYNLDQANFRQVTDEVYLKIPHKHADVQYASATASSITKNGVYVMMISDASSGLTTSGELRYTYLDT